VRQRRWGHGSRVRGSEEGEVSGSGRRGGGGQGGTRRRGDGEARGGGGVQGGACTGGPRGVLGVLGALVGQGVLTSVLPQTKIHMVHFSADAYIYIGTYLVLKGVRCSCAHFKSGASILYSTTPAILRRTPPTRRGRWKGFFTKLVLLLDMKWMHQI
jgi:hypothetical protein